MKGIRSLSLSCLMSIIGVGLTGSFQSPSMSFRQSPGIISQNTSGQSQHLSSFLLSGNFLGSTVDQPSEKIISPLTQQPSPNILGQDLLQEVVECVSSLVPTGKIPTLDELQIFSSQCIFQIVVLKPDGSIRSDANERMIALVQATGVTLPQPITQGEARIKLQKIPEQNLFGVPVFLNEKSYTFLLDTGASNSIVDQQITDQLGLEGSPIPNELLTYMVVGDNCNDITATLNEMPVIAVEQATAEGITGLGLPKAAIPGRVSGVLGIDFMSGFDMIINPQTLELQLLPPSPSIPNSIPLQGRMGIMTTQVSINGQGSYKFLLDTGADTMVISKDLAQKLSLNLTDSEDIEVKGFCGTEKGKKTSLHQFQLQQYKAQNLDAIILESEVLKLLGVEGIIGQNFLNQYQQHWRFSPRNELGFPSEGSLVLTAF